VKIRGKIFYFLKQLYEVAIAVIAIGRAGSIICRTENPFLCLENQLYICSINKWLYNHTPYRSWIAEERKHAHIQNPSGNDGRWRRIGIDRRTPEKQHR
jgi:hypothetical protein